MVTAYLDESGTHGGATITVMGGFAGTDSQWLIFEEKWDALKNEYLELQGVPIHATDLLRFKKQYSRWTEAKQLDFVVKACQIVADSGVYGMVASVDTTSYSRHLKAVDGIRMNIDTAYGTCFRQIMVETCKHVRAVYPEERVSFVVESGHKHRGDADRIFHLTKKDPAYNLGSFAVADKGDFGALQAADLISYCTHKHFQECLIKVPESPTLCGSVVSTIDRPMFLDERFAHISTLTVLSFAEVAGRLPRKKRQDVS